MTSALFLGFTALVASAVIAAAGYAFSRRAALATAAVLAAWFGFVSALALSGVIRNVGYMPPGITYVVGPTFVAGFFAPLALGVHALAIRAIRSRLRAERPEPATRAGLRALA